MQEESLSSSLVGLNDQITDLEKENDVFVIIHFYNSNNKRQLYFLYILFECLIICKEKLLIKATSC